MNITLELTYTELKDTIIFTLNYCNVPVKSSDIESALHISGRKVREIIKELRNEGYPIMNRVKDENGIMIDAYGYARNFSDMKPTIRKLRNEANSRLITINKFMKKYGLRYQYSLQFKKEA